MFVNCEKYRLKNEFFSKHGPQADMYLRFGQ